MSSKKGSLLPKILPQKAYTSSKLPPNTKSLSAKHKKAFFHQCITSFENLSTWSPETIKQTIKSSVEAVGLHRREAMPLLRKVLTGQEKGVELPYLILVLGKKETITRLELSA